MTISDEMLEEPKNHFLIQLLFGKKSEMQKNIELNNFMQKEFGLGRRKNNEVFRDVNNNQVSQELAEKIFNLVKKRVFEAREKKEKACLKMFEKRLQGVIENPYGEPDF